MENQLYSFENIAKYLEGELDDIKINEMEQEFLNDEMKDQEMKDFARLWKTAEEIAKYDDINAAKDWQRVRSRIGFKSGSKRIPFHKYFIRIAAILIVAIGMVWSFNKLIHFSADSEFSDYYTDASGNSIKELLLPDNSKITLNRNSKIIYNNNYGITNRDIILEGEAFFNVERNADIPFRVFTDNSTVEVLGTSFNIKQAENEIDVMVVEGRVAFYETSKKENRIELLGKEQSAYFSSENTFKEKTKLNTNNIAWMTGILSFNGESLFEVFETIAKIYELDLVLDNKKRYTEEITVDAFRFNTLNDALDNIYSASEIYFNYKIENNKLYISER